MKKLIPIFLAVFMLMSTQVVVGATVTKVSASGLLSPASYDTISGGRCTIVDNGDGTINISGSTSTYYKVGEIGVKLSLQYYSGGKWTTLKTYSYSKTDSDYVYGGKVISVSGGYNYRVVARHSSLDGGLSESGQSYSETIHIQK